MKVIARNDGPQIINGVHQVGSLKALKTGKEYDVIEWSYQDRPGNWINRTDNFINPKDPKFYIKVINEQGRKANYWNDYFLSNEEIRNEKLEKLGI